MPQKQLIIGVIAVVVVFAGLWFVWQRRGSEGAALNREIETETKAMNTDMAELGARLSR